MDAWDLTEEVSFRQKKTPQSREWHKMGKGKEPRKNMAPKDVLLWFRPLGLWIINSMAKELGLGFPGGASSKELTCQCRRHKRPVFDPWVGKIPWRRKWQPTPVILAWRIPWTEEPGGLQSTGSQRVGLD